MKAKIEVEQVFGKDVIASLKKDKKNPRKEVKEALEDMLYEMCEDWVLHNNKPDIVFFE